MVVDLLNSTEMCFINNTIFKVNHSTDDESSDTNESNEVEKTNKASDKDDGKEEVNFDKFIDKMICNIFDEKTMKSIMSEVTKLQNYEVTDTEDIQEDTNTEEPSVVVENEVKSNEKKEEITTITDTDEFELIKSV